MADGSTKIDQAYAKKKHQDLLAVERLTRREVRELAALAKASTATPEAKKALGHAATGVSLALATFHDCLAVVAREDGQDLTALSGGDNKEEPDPEGRG